MKFILTLYFGKYDIWMKLDNGKHALLRTVHGDKLNLVYDECNMHHDQADACWYASDAFMLKNCIATADDPEELSELVTLELL